MVTVGLLHRLPNQTSHGIPEPLGMTADYVVVPITRIIAWGWSLDHLQSMSLEYIPQMTILLIGQLEAKPDTRLFAPSVVTNDFDAEHSALGFECCRIHRYG